MSEYPYETDLLESLHPDGWKDVRPTLVLTEYLLPTQTHVVIKRLRELVDGAEPETGDLYPHVVNFKGDLYVHDGHHRYVLAVAKGSKFLMARVVLVEPSDD